MKAVNRAGTDLLRRAHLAERVDFPAEKVGGNGLWLTIFVSDSSCPYSKLMKRVR
ncbi:MAG: hypothetical protein ACJZ4L_02490 [Candidatus Poriferisodalaceae bacterium]